MKKPKPCMDCGRLAKELPSHFCAWCKLKRQPMHVQASAARRRQAAIPEGLRAKRNQKVIRDDTPPQTAFCASCQTFCPEWMFAASATQCRPCASIKGHEARTEKVYGISPSQYEELLERQGGRCAICRVRPKSKRLAVDHNHQTGEVRGLLCAGEYGCNKGLLGSAHDDASLLWSAYVYMSRPPATLRVGKWEKYLEDHPPLKPAYVAPKKSAFSSPSSGEPQVADLDVAKCEREHFLPAGSQSVPGKKGIWKIWVSDDPEADSPF